MIAGSFVRDKADVDAIKERIEGTDIEIIAKIEDPLGVKNFDEILENVHGIMVARGDLGVEVPYQQVPVLQKEFIRKCNAVGKPVIVATHMLESMTASPAPTRAEVSDVANAIADGTDAIMLSAETSTGQYPVEAVNTMASIGLYMEPMAKVKTYENDLAQIREYNKKNDDDLAASAVAIAKAAAEACQNLPVKAVIVLSQGGARMLSRHMIEQPIYAFVPSERVARKLGFTRGVYATAFDYSGEDRDYVVKAIISEAIKDKIIEEGDLVAIVIGAQVFSGTEASMLELHKVAK
jgi:pyruvate kinase